MSPFILVLYAKYSLYPAHIPKDHLFNRLLLGKDDNFVKMAGVTLYTSTVNCDLILEDKALTTDLQPVLLALISFYSMVSSFNGAPPRRSILSLPGLNWLTGIDP